jgi:hypothetical protein
MSCCLSVQGVQHTWRFASAESAGITTRPDMSVGAPTDNQSTSDETLRLVAQHLKDKHGLLLWRRPLRLF